MQTNDIRSKARTFQPKRELGDAFSADDSFLHLLEKGVDASRARLGGVVVQNLDPLHLDSQSRRNRKDIMPIASHSRRKVEILSWEILMNEQQVHAVGGPARQVAGNGCVLGSSKVAHKKASFSAVVQRVGAWLLNDP